MTTIAQFASAHNASLVEVASPWTSAMASPPILN